MRGRTISMVERPKSQHGTSSEQGNLFHKTELEQRRTSLSISSTNISKMDFSEKLERYKVLLQKEYELRAKLAKEYGNPGNPVACAHKDNTTSVICNCGRRISTTGSPLIAQSSRDVYLRPQQHMIRLRSHSEHIKRLERVRPLSADISLETPSSAALRKLATEEKMGKRRESLRSLEGDFEKAKDFMARARAFSNGSLKYDKKVRVTNVDDNNNNEDVATSPSSSSGSNNKLSNDLRSNYFIPSRISNDSGHYSSNESITSNSSQDMSNAVTNYINRRKERPLSSYI